MYAYATATAARRFCLDFLESAAASAECAPTVCVVSRTRAFADVTALSGLDALPGLNALSELDAVVRVDAVAGVADSEAAPATADVPMAQPRRSSVEVRVLKGNPKVYRIAPYLAVYAYRAAEN
ncbi:hypothetical protein ACGFNU_46000 [Spirillospora sp. NPDC048911]|uniref:hypothetical protein n=1 Tax=Spirillospora sp. NPDC048911 TaxID=3364527 RepID=UPI00370FAE65